jgi:phosphoenolpyruvate phosphomutase
MEVHSGFSALIVDKASARRADGSEATFDMLWSSSLTSSAIKGKPDIETVTTSERCQILEDALEVSNKPIIYDGDTGGEKEVFHFTVQRLERLGVSAVVIEDKRGLKQNSLFGVEREQQLEDIPTFCEKLSAGKKAQITKDFMIFARIEALIAGLGEEEALKRARAYVNEGGCDGIMIHSKEKSPDEVVSFLKRYRQEAPHVPVICVPTTYNQITEDELHALGCNICIHANQLLRASYLAMLDTANTILAAGRSKEVDGKILPTKEMITLIDDGTSKP